MSSKQELMVVIMCLVVGLLAGSVLGAGGTQRVWYVRAVDTDDDGNGQPGQTNALAARSNGVWPVVAYEGETALMGPTGWQNGPRAGDGGSDVDAAVGTDGRMGFAWADGMVQILDRTGWSTTAFGAEMKNMSDQRPSLAFNAHNMPAVLHNNQPDPDTGTGQHVSLAQYTGTSWHQDLVRNDLGDPMVAKAVALDFDSYGQANIAFSGGSNLVFAQKGVATNYEWSVTHVTDDPGLNVSNLRDLDMAITTTDMTWVGYADDNGLGVAVYDPIMLSWSMSPLDIDFTNTGHFTIAADSTGGIGVAYVDGDNFLNYRYNDGDNGWTDEIVRNFESNEEIYFDGGTASDIGLAFDADDNPVISYNMGGLYLAYDPIVVPEPATMALLVVGGLLVRRQRQS